ncbi:MAG: C10 family peptidase [Defluviitaleaceae bacterium]|nr:C10 family peptidase [Defluviitaleaceae bacterium]
MFDFSKIQSHSDSVEPLIQTQWGQHEPYKSKMVKDIRNRTGCGTTAIAQIMNYYKHPKNGAGQSKSYTTGLGTEVSSLDFEINYDWDNMLNTYNSRETQQQIDAVTTLMYHVAVSFKINDGSIGTDTGTSIPEIINAMTTHFGYDRSIQSKRRRYFDDIAWNRIIKEQLDAGMPVFYLRTGHYYIIDGYNSNGKYHFNWGWNGNRDGYYFLDIDWLPLYNSGEVKISEEDVEDIIIINIKPDAGYEMALHGLATEKATVARGEQFEVYIDKMVNVNPEHRFRGGEIGVLLMDNDDKILSIINKNKKLSEGSWWTRSTKRPLNCSIHTTVATGQYKLRIATKPTKGEWKIADLSENGTPCIIDISIEN